MLRPLHFNAILQRVQGSEHENVVNEVILRSQAQAEYVAHNYGHFGLNLRRYAHFTSPIRRYADLIVHRALITALGLGADGLHTLNPAELTEIAEHISSTERRAMVAERETTDRLIASYLSERIGATFSGRIAGVTRAGLFVKLTETGADGFIPLASLKHDYFHHDEARHAIIGKRSGETYRLGDDVEVRLMEAAPFAGALRFELLSDGKQGKNIFGAKRQQTKSYRSMGRSHKGKGSKRKITKSKTARRT
jgi:ribonuclease R